MTASATYIRYLFTDPALSAEYAAWNQPFLADPSDAAASAARTTQTRHLAAAILAAKVATRIADRLTIVTAGWSKQRGDEADAAAPVGSNEWIAKLGAHQHATLTYDGKAANRDAWCRCPEDPETWIRYEQWTARGVEAHGYVCRECRALTQTG